MSEPRPFDLKDPKEKFRWFVEMDGYLKNCNGMNFVDAGTDDTGRKLALDAFYEMKREAERKAKSKA